MSNFYVVGVEVVEEEFGWAELQVKIVFLTCFICVGQLTVKKETMNRKID